MHHRTLALGLLVILLVLEGLYAVRLNTHFYIEHAPFFDSCSYTNQLAEIHTTARTNGIAAAVKNSLLSRNVTLPWLETIAVSPFVSPSRQLGVWLQWIWLL